MDPTSSTASTTAESPPSARTAIRRHDERGHYDAETIHAIVDAAWLCHVAFTDTRGQGPEAEPFAVNLPTACWRIGDRLYIHGSNGSPMMKRLASGVQACVAITHLDGLVLARSAFSHSMNFRSVVAYGRFERVPEADKAAVLAAFMAHILPGRQAEVRPADENERKATLVLALHLNEASAKVREGAPCDKAEDAEHPAWAGVLPLGISRLAPLPDALSVQRGQAPSPAVLQWYEAAEAAPTTRP